jgi:PPOX class probable F420-dependent enzyme
LDKPVTLDPQVEHRLQTEQNLWLATVRPDGSPHLVPIWFVWVAGKIYLCTGTDSVKVRNAKQNPRVSIALEDGSQPIVIEGLARPIEQADSAVLAEFQRKYDWDITSDETYTQVIEIQPERIRA